MLAGDHTAKTPNLVTYSSMVPQDLVRIMLMVAALNDLDLKAAYKENSYLTVPCRENIWTRAGLELRINEGKIFIVVRSLYGLKSYSEAFREFLAEILYEMGFKLSVTDPDVWYREVKKSDREEYYDYILVYLDDFIEISLDARSIILEVAEKFKSKKYKIEPPEVYLGGRLAKKSFNGK